MKGNNQMKRMAPVTFASWTMLVGALALILAPALLAGCGQSSSTLAVETEHACRSSQYIAIINAGTTSISLDEWTLTYSNTAYALPDIVLAPDERIRVWSKAGTNDAHNIYMGRSGEQWDISREQMYLERSPSLFGTREMHFISCIEDLAP
jgi:hypothetical protein